MKICLTGGIACGKSLLSTFLNGLGVETLDADDVVHELVPEDERRRLAKVVFGDPAARKALEARLHPLVRRRFDDWFQGREPAQLRVAVIPLLFEVHWEQDYDIILCIASSRAKQIERMTSTRGYTLEEAEARLAAQMDVSEKASRSHYVIRNDGSSEQLKDQAVRLVAWLKEQVKR
jgi:dephospho-CoA kinase